jgi:hypothetical protein
MFLTAHDTDIYHAFVDSDHPPRGDLDPSLVATRLALVDHETQSFPVVVCCEPCPLSSWHLVLVDRELENGYFVFGTVRSFLGCWNSQRCSRASEGVWSIDERRRRLISVY